MASRRNVKSFYFLYRRQQWRHKPPKEMKSAWMRQPFRQAIGLMHLHASEGERSRRRTSQKLWRMPRRPLCRRRTQQQGSGQHQRDSYECPGHLPRRRHESANAHHSKAIK
ncbi:hypothetical protein HPP92_005124 [Vanilla planifolia]|uniref:Uncharacterized protein n=1 Tax=Vanilla planifolia TaxID=51239 RepID=A0A835VCX0_VANPL|nr:hypothetical protein HPP92_005124 [Vanilla planifolia]